MARRQQRSREPRRAPQPTPPPLPPETRTVGQLVAETIRFYARHFWRSLALGISVGVIDAVAVSLAARLLAHDVVDQIARRGGQDESAGAVDDHQQEAARQEPPARLHQVPDLGKHLLELRLGARVRRARRTCDRDRACAFSCRLPPCDRARPLRLRACARLARDACAHLLRRATRPVLPAARREWNRRAHGRLHRRSRTLTCDLPRRRAPLLRPSRTCRLAPPTEEAQCRRTSCCPT